MQEFFWTGKDPEKGEVIGKGENMAKKQTTYSDLLKMAKSYGVEDNALFLAAAEQYDLQQRVISLLKDGIEGKDLTTQKSYIAGEKNDYAAPLVKELPKHSDAANRTAGTILDIIVKLGRKPVDENEDPFNCD